MILLPNEFEFVRNFVRTEVGLSIDQNKRYLIETRLGPVAVAANCRTLSDLCRLVSVGQDEDLRRIFVDAITTHETSFFRNPPSFAAIEETIFPELARTIRDEGRTRRVRIWSMACSTGQEVYGLGILASRAFPARRGWDVSIRGSDISELAIERARHARYTSEEVQRTSRPDLMHYIQTDGDRYGVSDEIRALTTFDTTNLVDLPTGSSAWDMILCRNVTIYFDPPTRNTLAVRIKEYLRPGGYLLTGSSETVSDPELDLYRHGTASYYRLSQARRS